MNRHILDLYIQDTYKAKANYPWESTPANAVYRHKNNKKWFALVMDIPKSKLTGTSEEIVTVINLKCDPLLIGSVLSEEGIYPAYHMNMNHWISVIISEISEAEKLKWLLDLSFELTQKK